MCYVTPSSGAAGLRGAGLRLLTPCWRHLSQRRTQPPRFQERGEKPNQKNPTKTTCCGVVSFTSEKDAPPSAARRAGGFAAESLHPGFLTSRLNPEEGGKLLRLPALHRAKVSRNHVSYRKQMAFGKKIRLSNAKLCMENRGKSIQ